MFFLGHFLGFLHFDYFVLHFSFEYLGFLYFGVTVAPKEKKKKKIREKKFKG